MHLGIDLGTSNSAIAGNTGSELKLFKTAEGTDVLPSVIYIDKRGHKFIGVRAYDKAILEALTELGGGPVSGAKIKARVGGTPLQARTALNRLIEAGTVTFEGKARGTKYSLK